MDFRDLFSDTYPRLRRTPLNEGTRGGVIVYRSKEGLRLDSRGATVLQCYSCIDPKSVIMGKKNGEQQMLSAEKNKKG